MDDLIFITGILGVDSSADEEDPKVSRDKVLKVRRIPEGGGEIPQDAAGEKIPDTGEEE